MVALFLCLLILLLLNLSQTPLMPLQGNPVLMRHLPQLDAMQPRLTLGQTHVVLMQFPQFSRQTIFMEFALFGRQAILVGLSLLGCEPLLVKLVLLSRQARLVSFALLGGQTQLVKLALVTRQRALSLGISMGMATPRSVIIAGHFVLALRGVCVGFRFVMMFFGM